MPSGDLLFDNALLLVYTKWYILMKEFIMKTAKLFQNGRSQAVRLPKEFRFKGNEVFIKKQGDVVVLIPTLDPWTSLIDSLDLFSDDFMESREQPQEQIREDMFA